MKLYTAMLSPFAARCRMQIYAKGLEVDFIEAGSGFAKEELAEISPIAKMPVLDDNGLIIPESEVICEYLEDRFPENSLRPVDADSRAMVRLLSRIADTYVFASLFPLFAHLSRKRRDPEVVTAKLAELNKGLASIEYFLGDGDYAVGDSLTLADCCLVPILLFVSHYLTFFDISDAFENFPKISAYFERMSQQAIPARAIEEIRAAMAAL